MIIYDDWLIQTTTYSYGQAVQEAVSEEKLIKEKKIKKDMGENGYVINS